MHYKKHIIMLCNLIKYGIALSCIRFVLHRISGILNLFLKTLVLFLGGMNCLN